MNSLRLTALALTAFALSSCSMFSQQKAEDKPATPAEAKTEKKAEKTTDAAVTPTAEQQAAAAKILQEDTTPAVEEAGTVTPQTFYQSTSSIPGRSGLRMGRFAPPEEAASTGENAAPAPNAAELHGLRSPSLPKNLPLDVNGQSKKD